MSIASFMAAQLRRPSGFFGRHVLLYLLNRSNTHINELALEVMNLSSEDSVLEVGFGGGDLMSKMAKVATKGFIAGVDFSQDVVDACSKRFRMLVTVGRIDLKCADVEELPFEDGTFTKACAVNVIYFWANPLVPLRQIHRVLKENGKLVLCFTPREFMENRSVMRHGFTLYEPSEVSALFVEAGYREVRVSSGKHLLGQCVAVEGKK
jgi:ubiquinone/menaquinone biosynthesis C-methylase UbiE